MKKTKKEKKSEPRARRTVTVGADGFREYHRGGKLSARAFIRQHLELPLSKLVEKLRKAGYYTGVSETRLTKLVERYQYHIKWEMLHTKTSPRPAAKKDNPGKAETHSKKLAKHVAAEKPAKKTPGHKKHKPQTAEPVTSTSNADIEL